MEGSISSENTIELIEIIPIVIQELSRYPSIADTQKLHLLIHIVDNIRRFGPPWVFNVEHFEMMNKMTREAIVDSNGHNDSKNASLNQSKKDCRLHLANRGIYVDEVLKHVYVPGSRIIEIGNLFISSSVTNSSYQIGDIFKINQVYYELKGNNPLQVQIIELKQHNKLHNTEWIEVMETQEPYTTLSKKQVECAKLIKHVKLGKSKLLNPYH